ncbi:hypothetical protein V0M98_35480 (plasmid) [Pseudomonas silesiensis]|uniref:hypothetical protein n=1 Tax=Pseudomonas silesiensis TaxID=1853130 RepID=UPI0030CC116F
MKLIKRVGLLTMFAFAVAGPVQADVIFKTCAWIEKNGAVLSSAPEGCYIQHEVGKRSLKDRLEAAKPEPCSGLLWSDEGKIFMSIGGKTDERSFVVARQCRKP